MKIKTLDAMPDLLDTDYVSKYLGVTRQFLYRKIKNKEITAIRVARKYRIPKKELKKIIEQGVI